MQNALNMELPQELAGLENNPVVGKLATELLKNLETREALSPDQSMDLINQMLSYAAETEQLIAEQKNRIDFLESLSNTDELSGLLNRRGFTEMLRQTLSNARRHHETGMLCYIDLDGFKDINDKWGHEAGDKVIKEVSRILKTQVRKTDFIGRLGGDEFAVLLVRAEQMPARARAMAVRAELNAASVEIGDVEIPIRASFGLEVYGPTSTSKELLRRADRAMYKDKQSRAHRSEG